MTVTKPIEEYAIWLYLRDTHCAFLRKRKNLNLCTNDYTVNGVHAYVFCPLLALHYITVKLEGTTVVAFKKNPGVRIPSQMWEKVELPQTKEEGMQELKSYAEQMEIHAAMKEELFRRAEQLFEIAEELRMLPKPDEEIPEEDLLEEDLLEEDLLEEDLLEEDLLEEDLEELVEEEAKDE